MANIGLFGFEEGHQKATFDLADGSVQTDILPGSWSAYSGRAGIASLDAQASELYCGFRYYTNNSGGLQIFDFMSPNGQVNIRIDQSSGRLRILRGTGTVLATGAAVITTGVWYYIEVYLLIHDTTGKYEMKVNGVTDVALATSQDTRNDAGANGDKIDRVQMSTDGNQRNDDVYVNDVSGSVNVGYWGDVRVRGRVGNAAGSVTGLTRGGTDSGSNFGQTDEIPPNDATDYVFAADTTSYDLYGMADTSGLASVKAAKLSLRAQKSDASAASIAPMIKSGATENQGADQALSTSWAYHRKYYNVDPTDSNAWTPAKIDGLQIGVKSR
jgi:hypothetical protein